MWGFLILLTILCFWDLIVAVLARVLTVGLLLLWLGIITGAVLWGYSALFG